MLPGQTGVAYFTFRSVNTAALSVVPVAFAFLPNSSGAQPTETSVTLNGPGASTANSGEWVTAVYTFTMPNSQYDHIRIALRGPTAQTSALVATLEIGAMQLALL